MFFQILPYVKSDLMFHQIMNPRKNHVVTLISCWKENNFMLCLDEVV